MSENPEKGKLEEIKMHRENGLYLCTIGGKDFAFKKWTWGEKNRVTQISLKFLPSGQSYLDVIEFNANMLLATLKKAPFTIDRATLDSYPESGLIDKLVQITTELNLSKPAEIQNL